MTRWATIPGFDNWYEVSEDGRVRSWRNGRWPGRRRVPKVLFQFFDAQGYPVTQLTVNGRQHIYAIHRLLAGAFLGPRPPGLEVRHVDGVKTHCVLSNLAYGTKSENQRDNVAHGTHGNARKTHCPAMHPYDERNTRINPDGSRECRACCRERARARRASYAKAVS